MYIYHVRQSFDIEVDNTSVDNETILEFLYFYYYYFVLAYRIDKNYRVESLLIE